ncbi:MAG: hypothetical protein PUA72_11130 [Lachnospiraceae bacterium]|nr:hypothetical protein [Lachnospiraceae bacterium]
MERCTLCGGPVVNGRCTECGWNNRKNDSKYRLNEHNRKTVRMHGGSCEDHLNQPDKKQSTKQMARQEAAAEKAVRKAQSTSYRTTMEDTAARRRELKKRGQTGTVQKRKKWLWVIPGILILNVISSAWSWLDEENIDLGDAVTKIVQYFEGDSSIDEVFRTDEEAVEVSDADAPAQEERQEWDTGDANYYEECLEPGSYTVGYDIPAGRYQLECREGSTWIYISDPDGADWSDYQVLYSEAYQDWIRENADEDEEWTYGAYSDVLDLAEDQVLYIENVYGGVWLTGLKEDGATLAERETQGLKTIRYQAGMEPGNEIPEGVYDLVLRNPEAGAAYVQIHGEDGTEMYLALSEDVPVIRRISIREDDTLEYDDYDTDIEVDFVPSY